MNHLARTFLLLVLTATGCTESSVGNTPQPPLKAPVSYGMAPPSAENIPDFSGMTDSEKEAFFAAMHEAQIAITEAASRAETWGEADGLVRRALAEALASKANLPAYQVETLAATHMLNRAFSREASAAPTDDIAYYTDMLVRNDSPNAPLLSNALHALDGTWGAAKIRRAARHGVAASERFEQTMVRRTADRRLEAARGETDRQAGVGSAQDEVQAAAVRRLEALAAEG